MVPRNIYSCLFRVATDSVTNGNLLVLEVVAVCCQLSKVVRSLKGPVATPVLRKDVRRRVLFPSLAHRLGSPGLVAVRAVVDVREVPARTSRAGDRIGAIGTHMNVFLPYICTDIVVTRYIRYATDRTLKNAGVEVKKLGGSYEDLAGSVEAVVS